MKEIDFGLYKNNSFEEIEKIKVLNHKRYEGLTKSQTSDLICSDIDDICDFYTDDVLGDEKSRILISSTFYSWHEKYFNDGNIVDIPYGAIRFIMKGI